MWLSRCAARANYVLWSGLDHLDEVVSLDSMRRPTVQIAGISEGNPLCVYRSPPAPPAPLAGPVTFEFLGYDLVDVEGTASALTNCGGFPDVFENRELSSKGRP
jgi:hypothetical protein